MTLSTTLPTPVLPPGRAGARTEAPPGGSAAPAGGASLSVLAIVHGYPGPVPGGHNAGAEQTLREFMVHLASRGHFVRVLTQRGVADDDNEGVRVGVGARPSQIESLIRGSEASPKPDVIVTHLDRTREAVRFGRVYHIPVVHLVHNDRQLDWHKVASAGLVVFNSQWLSSVVEWDGPRVVIHPPVDPRRHVMTPGECITLVNAMQAKGAETFYELARRIPEAPFLAVYGSYGRQMRMPNPPPNVRLLESTDDMRPVWAKTRILLLPSSYESYGRVAVEAACSGIPTVASDLPGPREALGDAGFFLPPDIDAWEAAVRRLLDGRSWGAASKKAKARAKVAAAESVAGRELFESELVGLVSMSKVG